MPVNPLTRRARVPQVEHEYGSARSGNVPLAAVLWNGGISFGGVLAFMGSLIAKIREWLGIGKKP